MIRAIFYGVIAIFTSAIICSFIFALLLKLTSYDETSLRWVMHVLAFLSLFFGGLIAGGKGKVRGWLLGGATGVIFTTIIFLFQFLGMDQTFSGEQWGYHTGFLITAIIGGMIGVNVATSRSRSA
ncbi:TIGR04086 family membrane protein [Anoxybacillus flavithermus]|uniref:TIGR04086 family membrane protein n=1 Tax=Anoxybacillus flavithermus TaxID=33934 RepID=UPI001866BF24|nr:TIGR04086 family membrane protein [Anoxybacillus flavithermus]MBE2939130.1 TIGR04086 family membrane protein [Anoxybacillus flavithermus]MBE2941899.1 TIGR04086 family membrane protein [Anoxybacillus flavithermus]MBE2950136.1 TIGR04086 family membrane protein [Anoxybacillus flavithermus]MBE2952654.1 TIGR04086 family membrane protein [Anoxybacillus flavithermus]MBE2958012.1 TIGR04086 family membrane protein [Anoxybacillus flavithermus]